MSPEQASGDKGIDARTDIYSLAAVLYEMLAGEAPYTGTNRSGRHRQAPDGSRAERAAGSGPTCRLGWTGRSSARWPRSPPTATPRRATSPGRCRRRIPPRPRPPSPPRRPRPPSTRRPRLLRRRRRTPPAARPRSHPRCWDSCSGSASCSRGGARTRRGRPTPARRCWRCSRSRTSATRPTPTWPTASPTSCAASCRSWATSRSSPAAARTSTGTRRKPPQDIARELGADYLLTATVQWEKLPDGTSRVRVSPELVDVTPGHAPRTKWQQPFDAAITDVFQVQADIAGQVASALNVALGAGQKQTLTERPTENLAAYDAFLKGEATQGIVIADPPSLRSAITYYERAVALDSTFALAWAQLGRAHATYYYNVTPNPTSDDGGQACRRAGRGPGAGPARIAAGRRHLLRQIRGRQRQGARRLEAGLKIAPDNADLLDRRRARRAEPGPVGRRREAPGAGLDARPSLGDHRAAPVAKPAPPQALPRGGGRRRPGPGRGAGQSRPDREQGHDPPGPGRPARRPGRDPRGPRRGRAHRARGLHRQLLGSPLGARRRPAAAPAAAGAGAVRRRPRHLGHRAGLDLLPARRPGAGARLCRLGAAGHRGDA